MMTGAVLNSWKAVKNHVPLIKFRKGGPYRGNTPTGTSTTGSGKPSESSAPPRKTQPGPLIEDWELPPHYRRAALDQIEIDAINSGGAY